MQRAKNKLLNYGIFSNLCLNFVILSIAYLITDVAMIVLLD